MSDSSSSFNQSVHRIREPQRIKVRKQKRVNNQSKIGQLALVDLNNRRRRRCGSINNV